MCRDTDCAETLISLVKNQNYETLVTNPLTASKTAIKKVLDATNDGTVVFQDTTFIDGQKKVQDGIECIIEDVQQANGNENHSHHLICIVSKFAGRNVSDDCVCRLSFEGVKIKCDDETTQHLVGQLDALLIQAMEANFSGVENWIDAMITISQHAFTDDIPSCRRNLWVMILGANYLMKQLFHFILLGDGEMQQVFSWLSSSNAYMDDARLIVNDFSLVINKHIRDRSFGLIQKTDDTHFEEFGNDILIFDNDVCVTPSLLLQVILPEMSTVGSEDMLMDALRNCAKINQSYKGEMV